LFVVIVVEECGVLALGFVDEICDASYHGYYDILLLEEKCTV
jgi:hypothetical protein